ncbi:putative oxidoreductase [Massarina eburnea CBS 473.64]|uniref:Putative oxidoreductase n=1 Tax=Massarina eburnea CBS 473.64 TaxID=1395130 RepID=A0A6A6RMI1_9PLEO|nr:putative oxidoreductase [Massarina eburnea CBS 473.64]
MAARAPPLRTALIGLSSSAATSWASGAHLPGLLSQTGRSKLPITALLNSSVEAAKAAINSYDLPSTTKAYGSPEDLANDPEIDFVICNTRVDKHFQTILPSVKKGKDVYVEWPIASNLDDVNVLVDEARKSGSRVAVGLQRRWVPPVTRVRELLKEGRLGKVLSSDVRAFGGTNDREILPESLKYFADRKVGGNPIVIGFMHMFDFVLSALGDLDLSTVSTKLQLQRPDIRIRNRSTNEIVDQIRSDVPDLLSLHGTLASSQATLSVGFRRGQPFPGTPSFVWTINCEKGEIRVVSPAALSLESGDVKNPVTIHVHWFADDIVEEVKWEWNEEQQKLPLMARSVMRCLTSIADGKAEGDGWVGLEDAAKRAKMVDGFLRDWDKSSK